MGTIWRRLVVAASASGFIALGWMPVATPVAAATPPLSIGIDNVSPMGHNLEYTDFFPRGNVNVHSGDLVDFNWLPSKVGLHTATLLPTTMTPDQAWAANHLVVPDSSDPAGSLPVFNPAIAGPTHPPAGAPAPGACGSASAPCTFDGTSLLNSGANTAGSHFVVKMTGGAGTYDIVCLIHPGMHLSVNVVAAATAASTQAELDAASAPQYNADTADAMAAMDAATSTTTTNPDGTHTVTAHAGAITPHVAVDEMLPANLAIHPGDKVVWAATANNIHTVTFPAGAGSNSIDPFANSECETASGPEPPATGPPPFGCGPDPTKFEQLFDASPSGPTAVRNGGYRTGANDGGVFNYGNSLYYGSASQLHVNSPVVALVNTSSGQGYWQVTAAGGVYTYGDAAFLGSAAGPALSAPIVGMVASPFDDGYVLLGADGKAYPFGNVTGLGPPLPAHLAAPVVGGATSAGLQGPGAWIAAADGGVFNQGAAPFLGSAGALHLAKPIVGIAATADGGGYWLVASDGGIFNYGNAPFLGSLGAMRLNAPIVGMTATGTDQGYQLVGADGGVFDFGDARFAGSAGSLHLVSPMNSIGTVVGTVATSGVLAAPPLPYPTNYTFSFPESGTFGYQCRIHNNMRGVVTVG